MDDLNLINKKLGTSNYEIKTMKKLLEELENCSKKLDNDFMNWNNSVTSQIKLHEEEIKQLRDLIEFHSIY